MTTHVLSLCLRHKHTVGRCSTLAPPSSFPLPNPPLLLPATTAKAPATKTEQSHGARLPTSSTPPSAPPLHTSCADTQTHSAPAAQRDVGGDCGVCPEKKKKDTHSQQNKTKPGTEEEVGAKFAKTPSPRPSHHHHHHPTTQKKKEKISRECSDPSVRPPDFLFLPGWRSLSNTRSGCGETKPKLHKSIALY